MLARDIEMFIEHCGLKGLSTKTINSYEQTLRLFMQYMDEQGILLTEKITHLAIQGYIKEFEEDIPDLGRHCLMCNSCGEPSYPKCMEDCGVERERIEREQKKAQEKIAKHKVEIDILAGLVRDGLLKVEDAAPRVEMTVEEFEAAMKN